MIQKEVSFLVWLDVKMWINILNIAFLWRSGNSDLVKQPEIQSWIMFVLYDLRWVYMYFCLPENSLYISFFFSEKETSGEERGNSTAKDSKEENWTKKNVSFLGRIEQRKKVCPSVIINFSHFWTSPPQPLNEFQRNLTKSKYSRFSTKIVLKVPISEQTWMTWSLLVCNLCLDFSKTW